MKQIKIGDTVKSVGTFIPYRGKVTKDDGLHVWVQNKGLEYRIPKNILQVIPKKKYYTWDSGKRSIKRPPAHEPANMAF